MRHEILSRLNTLVFFGGITLIMTACQGSDSSTKTTKDTVTSATDTVKVAKKKGKTSATYTATKNGKIHKDAQGIYSRAEVAPEFPGGQAALSNYINNNLNYTQTAIDNGVNGTIHITFVVDEQGKVLNPQVIDGKNLSNELDEETVKMFNNMPLWKPGLVKGKKVKTRLELPVTFQLEEAQL